MKEYSDKNIKVKLWNEVCEAVFEDWNDLSPEDRNKKGKICYFLYYKENTFHLYIVATYAISICSSRQSLDKNAPSSLWLYCLVGFTVCCTAMELLLAD